MDKSSGRPAGRPRRLRMRTDRPFRVAARASRKGDGEACVACADGRHRQAKVARPSAATCKRRRPRASTPWSSQSRMPAKPSQASNCSPHHAACFPARMTTRRSSDSPAAIQAGAFGTKGGSTSASQPPSADRRARAGRSRVSSPRPLLSVRISVRQPRGQPPPGSSASSSGWPLGTASSSSPAMLSPRQISPLASTSARTSGNGAAFMTGY